MQIIEDAVRDNIPLAQAIEELRRAGHPDLPRFAHSIHSPVVAPGPARQWTPEQEKALAKIISIDETRRVWMGSLEITELIRRRLAHEGSASSPVTALRHFQPGNFQPHQPVRRRARGQVERFLVQRECGTHYLRRDGAGCEGHARRP